MPPLLAGGLIGVVLAANLDDMRTGWLPTLALALAAVVVLFNPAKWLHGDQPEASPQAGPVVLALLFGVGVWGGLIALDSATYALAVLVLVAHFPIREANAIKVLGLGLVAFLGVMVFGAKGHIDWLWAVPLSIAGIAGSLIGTRVSLGPNARKWIFWILVAVISVEAVRIGFDYL